MTRARVASVLALACAALLGACAGGATEHRVALDDGSEILLDLGGIARREEAENRVAFHLGSGFVVTLQDVLAHSEQARIHRTSTSVAEALVSRVALGEREGALDWQSCAVGELRGECVEGWMLHENRRFERSGVVFAHGERIVWLDVAATGASAEEVHSRARALMARTKLVERGVEATNEVTR